MGRLGHKKGEVGRNSSVTGRVGEGNVEGEGTQFINELGESEGVHDTHEVWSSFEWNGDISEGSGSCSS